AREGGGDVANRAPFRGVPERELALAASIEGVLPEWLAGDLLRTCPAVFRRGKWEARHWFDALGMLYQFRVAGGSVSYRQRLMETETSRAIRDGDVSHTSFGTPTRRGLFSRLRSPVPASTDNVNVNVVALGGDRVALTESPHQWIVDAETLALTARVRYEDGQGELGMIAHPHYDFARDRVVSLGIRLGRRTHVVLYEHAPSSRERSIVGTIDLRRLPYIHSFGLTPRHAVVIGHPFEVNPLTLLASNRGFIDHFRWRPEQGTRLWLIDRHTGAVRQHTAPAGFVFHVVNAFEDAEHTCIDLVLFPDPDIVERLRTSQLATRGFPEVQPSIVRWTMRPGVEAAQSEVLLAQGFEFPVVSYRKCSGQRYRLAFGARIRAGGGALRGALVRLDLESGERSFEREGFVFGEPTFVGRPGAEEEDDGVLLSVGSHVSESRSAMVVLDARSLDQRAWAEVPFPIPLGFHGSFFRA
ncbi:MAG TPA: carotenoid oxygenase family protein, partial [Polyangiaceae bacterium]|nr:carotenoid oxygenase family protein [Polyangiaceae bacterium]